MGSHTRRGKREQKTKDEAAHRLFKVRHPTLRRPCRDAVRPMLEAGAADARGFHMTRRCFACMIARGPESIDISNLLSDGEKGCEDPQHREPERI